MKKVRVSLRFKVTAGDGRVLFVYGRDEAQARKRLSSVAADAVFELAGRVEGGVVHVPPEEWRAVTGSIVEGRVAPGA
jgi:hypothetical protein